jgi:acetyltransferase-like isoleucine patch superfamily enzyme
VRIGEFAIVHPRATILPGVSVGDNAVIGAGAVVLKDVPAGATVFGNPAKVIFQKPE